MAIGHLTSRQEARLSAEEEGGEEEQEKEEEEDSSYLSSSSTVACSQVVLLVVLHLALCSLLSSTGPRCWAFWLVWTDCFLCALRRQRQLLGQDWFYWLRYTSCVFSLVCRQARDVRHHGRYGLKGLLRRRARRRQSHVYGWFCWFLHLALSSLSWCAGPDARHHGRCVPGGFLRVFIPAVACARLHALQYVPSFFGRLVMLGITAGMDQKEGYVAPCRKLWKIRSCSSSTRSSSSSSWCKG